MHRNAKTLEKSKIRKCFELFVTFLKASTFTFAGGLAIVPAIEKDAVEKYALLERDEFMEYATLSQTLPGVIALNCAALVGRRAAGFWGMLAAGFGAILPAFGFMLLATVLANMIPKEGIFLGIMRGVRAASAALVLAAAFTLGQHNIKDAFAVVVMIAAFGLALTGSLGAPLIIVGAALAGFLYRRMRRKRKEGKKDAS